MIRVLLADDSPHAQRMGKEILSEEEGFEVLGVTDGEQAMANLSGFAPDLVLADVCMPGPSGYRICEQIKGNPALGHVKVVLLVGALEPFDDAEAKRVGADQVVRKPFEPTLLLETIRPLTENHRPPPAARGPGEPDPERVRAAVVLAVESALPAILNELTERVLEALDESNSKDGE